MVKFRFGMFFIFSLLLFFSAMNAYSQKVTPGHFASAEKGFSIDFPKDWQKTEGFMGATVVALRPGSGSSDEYRENINVLVEKLSGHWALKEYFDANLESMRKLLTDFKAEEKAAAVVHGVPAERIVYSHRMGTYRLKALVYMMFKNQRGYVITCTSTSDRFAEWEKIFQGTANTFLLQ